MKALELHEFISKNANNICQITAYKDNKKIYSDTWNNFGKDDTCHVMSVTKSIVSILIGIAVDQGLIKSIKDKVLDYFPTYQIKRGEKTIQEVTIEDLLSMSAPYKYKYEPWVKVCTSCDWTVAALDFLGGRKGKIGEFRYSTLGIHILSGIIYKTSKMTPVEFANKYLFLPLGIKKHTNYLALTKEEHKEFTISKSPKKNIWFCDPLGVGTAGYGLCFSADDMAKIGVMCLNKGEYDNKRIVSAKWLEESTMVKHVCGDEFKNMLYGYLWWIIDEEKHIYAAIGNSGNVIYIDESKKIVVAVTSTFKPTVFDRVEFIQKYIIPYLENL